MTIARYSQILEEGPNALTLGEVNEGWHFCRENEGHLINTAMLYPFPEVEKCQCECFNLK